MSFGTDHRMLKLWLSMFEQRVAAFASTIKHEYEIIVLSDETTEFPEWMQYPVKRCSEPTWTNHVLDKADWIKAHAFSLVGHACIAIDTDLLLFRPLRGIDRFMNASVGLCVDPFPRTWSFYDGLTELNSGLLLLNDEDFAADYEAEWTRIADSEMKQHAIKGQVIVSYLHKKKDGVLLPSAYNWHSGWPLSSHPLGIHFMGIGDYDAKLARMRKLIKPMGLLDILDAAM